MHCRWTSCGAVLIASLGLAACSRSEQRAADKIAIPPFENLTADPELDWMSRGLSEAIRLQLTGSARIQPQTVAALRDAPSIGASRILLGYFEVQGRRLQVHAVLEDAARVRTVRAVTASGDKARGMAPLADALARQLDPQARPPATGNEAALHSYVQALNTSGGVEARGAFEQAAAADGNFGAAWLAWAQWHVGRGEREQALQVIAAVKGARLPAIEATRLELLRGALAADENTQRAALARLAKLTPADAEVFRALGDMDLTRRACTAAAQWYSEAVARDPDNPLLLNQLGYAQAYARDLPGAVKSLTRYHELRPEEANPLDSLGDVYFYRGRFQEAENFYRQGYAKDASFLQGGELYKIAWARLMRGEIKGADEAFGKFLEARRAARDPLAGYRQAQWQFLTGRHKQALAGLEELARAPQPALASLASAQLAIWNLQLGDAARAREYALRAAPVTPLALIARLVTEAPAGAAEWAARAARAFPQPSAAREHALAYALLLSRQFPAAVAVLQRWYEHAQPGSGDGVEALYAWALVENGQMEQAVKVDANPMPNAVSEQPLLCLAFPRLWQVRAAIADKQGRKEEALAYRQRLMLVSARP